LITQSNTKWTMWRNIVKIVVGIALGLTLSMIPIVPFVIPVLSIVLLIVLAIRVRRFGWRRDIVTVFTACIVLVVCAFLPVKELDVEVGPIAYGNLSLSDLCDRLHADYGIICRPPHKSTYRLSFSTDRPLSRRRVLAKLSTDTNLCLHIGNCGTNATILFGGYPSFTYLEEFP
jgi:hypothetical protein